ncbi:MAG TPA: YceI family protein [Blastocatellia bacterium]|nr:YceI family protein [Blastocatellia bacterium]
MKRLIATTSLIAISVLAAACADPAADKPKAATASAAAESTYTKPAGAETLALSPESSKIEFIGAKVTASHNGSFTRFSGGIDFVPDKPEASRVTIDIDLASVVTDDERLTGHLKSPDFFDVAKYQKATFISTDIKAGGDGGATHTITGNLDLHGVKKSLSFPARLEVTPLAVAVNSEFAINRKEFGILYPGKVDDLIRDDVVIKLSIKAPRGKA